MGSQKQPFLYYAGFQDERLPPPMFDPKAVTRASWEPKLERRKPHGPLVSFDRHLDPDDNLTSNHIGLMLAGISSTSWIKAIRLVQLTLRVLHLNGALCLIVLSALITNMATLTAWLLRITPAAVAMHSIYAIYHLSRDVAARPPASSAAYQTFAAGLDFTTVGLYVYNIVSVKSMGFQWGTRLAYNGILDYLVPALFWTLITTSSLHCLSVATSSWLAWQFKLIARIPPDMNPLEDSLAPRTTATGVRMRARASLDSGTVTDMGHKRNQSSIATQSMFSDQGDDSLNSNTPSLLASVTFQEFDSQVVAEPPSWFNDTMRRQYRPVEFDTDNSPRKLSGRDAAISSNHGRTRLGVCSETQPQYHTDHLYDDAADIYDDANVDLDDSGAAILSGQSSGVPQPTWPVVSIARASKKKSDKISTHSYHRLQSDHGKMTNSLQKYDINHMPKVQKFGENDKNEEGWHDSAARHHPASLAPRSLPPSHHFPQKMDNLSSPPKPVSPPKPKARLLGNHRGSDNNGSVQLDSGVHFGFCKNNYGELGVTSSHIAPGGTNRNVSSSNDLDWQTSAVSHRRVSGKQAEEGLIRDGRDIGGV